MANKSEAYQPHPADFAGEAAPEPDEKLLEEIGSRIALAQVIKEPNQQPQDEDEDDEEPMINIKGFGAFGRHHPW